MSRGVVIVIIIALVVIAAAVGVIVLVKANNKKKAKKLQENLEKYKKESSNNGLNLNVSVIKNELGETISDEELFFDSKKDEEKDIFSPDEQPQAINDDFPDNSYSRMPTPTNSRRDEEQERKNRDKEFEDFLDEHAFSRKVFDKNLLEQFQEMSPEVKMMIMDDLFRKNHGDDKK